MSINNLPIQSTIDAVMPVKVLSKMIFDYYYLSPLELDNELITTFRKKMLKKTKKIFSGILKYSGYPLAFPKQYFDISASLHYSEKNEISLHLYICLEGKSHLIGYQKIDRANGSIYYNTMPGSDDEPGSDYDYDELLIKKYVCSVGNKRLKYSAEFHNDCLENLISYVSKYFIYPSSDSNSESD